jgi:curved DNA-binding protein CbpA
MNPYEVLEVHKADTIETIKQQYRKLSKKYHPDKEGGDKEKFAELASAWEILKDPKRRKAFDHFGILKTGAEIKKKAEALLQQVFQTLVAQSGLARILQTDVVQSMNDLLDKGIGELDRKHAEAESNVVAINKVLDKFTFKNENNPIREMLQSDIKKHEGIVTQVNGEREIAKHTYRLLKDYKFDPDSGFVATHSMNYGGGSFAVNFSGTGGGL